MTRLLAALALVLAACASGPPRRADDVAAAEAALARCESATPEREEPLLGFGRDGFVFGPTARRTAIDACLAREGWRR